MMHPRFQRFSAPGDRRQRIVDLVRDAGGQETYAGQLLAADHLLGTLFHLSVQVVTNLLESSRHIVHGRGQFGHLVAGGKLDTVVKLS